MYIGQTGRRLWQRMEEHKKGVKLLTLIHLPWLNMPGRLVIRSTGIMYLLCRAAQTTTQDYY